MLHNTKSSLCIKKFKGMNQTEKITNFNASLYGITSHITYNQIKIIKIVISLILSLKNI
jgi:hypothetical protein